MPLDKEMIKKIFIASSLFLSGIGLALAAPMSTTTLGENIDIVSGTTQDYFSVLIAKFWPFLLGAIILIGVIVFGKKIIHRLFGS